MDLHKILPSKTPPTKSGGYNIRGKFYEACDCEIICSCWAEIDPAMGECTGIYAWQLEAGSVVNGVDVTGGLVVMLSYGASCDDADHMLILIGGLGGDLAKQDVLKLAVQFGPWAEVVKMTSNDPTNYDDIITGVNITLSNTSLSANYTSASPPRSVEVAANWVFAADANSIERTTIQSNNPASLIHRITGQPPQPVEVGRIAVPSAGATGLSLLAESKPSNNNKYLFDIDITQVTAIRGPFHYQSP
jgi:hypothetical protein